MKATDFTRRTTVYAADGIELGEITETWSETSDHGLLPHSRHLIADYGPVRGTAELLDTPNGFVQVRQGALLGFGGRDLFVPFSQIRAAGAGSVTLRYHSAQCEAQFADLPLTSDRLAEAA